MTMNSGQMPACERLWPIQDTRIICMNTRKSNRRRLVVEYVRERRTTARGGIYREPDHRCRAARESGADDGCSLRRAAGVGA
ncbi:MAG: hypothetical protein M0Q23_04620 [Syntrophales bacterium]|nr:hypothetical protein [Syntrophales bacterium]MCK9527924.1 hypothetical protein [Syntrophales bacterium]MDX9921900.1 hypothetical protein [Syntrophales bacterium]